VFTACDIMHARCCRPATSWVHYTKSCKHSSWGWAKSPPETCWADWDY